jgi:hypothetical protein
MSTHVTSDSHRDVMLQFVMHLDAACRTGENLRYAR